MSNSEVLYQNAIGSLLKFWHLNGQCKYCPLRTDIKQIVDQQIVIQGVKVLTKK